MPRHRSHSVEFKRRVIAEYHAGESLHALARRHDLSRNLIRIWIEKAEAGALDQDVASAELLTAYEARIAALQRLVGRQALEIELSQRGLTVGGQIVDPGDIIIGDEDGLVAFPPSVAEDLLIACRLHREAEDRTMQAIAEGSLDRPGSRRGLPTGETASQGVGRKAQQFDGCSAVQRLTWPLRAVRTDASLGGRFRDQVPRHRVQ